jgi:hypothetical protein
VSSLEAGLEVLSNIQGKLKTPRTSYPSEKAAIEDLALVLHFEHTNEEYHSIELWQDLITMELRNRKNEVVTPADWS